MARHSDDVNSAYDLWAPTYDGQHNPTRDLDGALLRDLDWPWDRLDVLEIGCGTGKNSAWLAARARSLLGLDLSDEMLARARDKVPAARFERADLTAPWPVADRSVDAVLANLVLEHIADLDFVAGQAARVLRGSGRYRVSEFHPWRQLRGGGAHFEADGATVRTPVVVHATAAHVMAGLRAGMHLERMSEDREPGSTDAAPRLLVLTFRRPSVRHPR